MPVSKLPGQFPLERREFVEWVYCGNVFKTDAILAGMGDKYQEAWRQVVDSYEQRTGQPFEPSKFLELILGAPKRVSKETKPELVLSKDILAMQRELRAFREKIKENPLGNFLTNYFVAAYQGLFDKVWNEYSDKPEEVNRLLSGCLEITYDWLTASGGRPDAPTLDDTINPSDKSTEKQLRQIRVPDWTDEDSGQVRKTIDILTDRFLLEKNNTVNYEEMHGWMMKAPPSKWCDCPITMWSNFRNYLLRRLESAAERKDPLAAKTVELMKNVLDSFVEVDKCYNTFKTR